MGETTSRIQAGEGNQGRAKCGAVHAKLALQEKACGQILLNPKIRAWVVKCEIYRQEFYERSCKSERGGAQEET